MKKLILPAFIIVAFITSCQEVDELSIQELIVMEDVENRRQLVPTFELPIENIDEKENSNSNARISGSWVNDPGCFIDIEISSSFDYLAVGCNGRVYRKDLAGNWIVDLKASNAVMITADPYGNTLMINRNNDIWVDTDPDSNTNDWIKIAGQAIDIAASATGELFCIGRQKKVFQYNHNLNSWTEVPGSSNCVRIAAGYTGIYMVNHNNDIWEKELSSSNSSWKKLSGAAIDIGMNGFDLQVAGTNGRVFYYDFWNNNWKEILGAGNMVRITVGNNSLPWAINNKAKLWEFRNN